MQCITAAKGQKRKEGTLPSATLIGTPYLPKAVCVPFNSLADFMLAMTKPNEFTASKICMSVKRI